MEITWKEYKEIASSQIEENGSYIYRGQRDSSWSLMSTLMRTDLVWSLNDFQSYFNFVLPQVLEKIEAWEGRTWDLSSQLGLAEFSAYLQHNGFPTPLLDCSYSPYVAAYFAFEGVDHFDPQTDDVSIYCFNQKAWGNKFKQEYDIAHDNAHVSVLRPRIVGNHKLSLQQGCFTFSNAKDIEVHIRAHETEEEKYLTKYTLDVKEMPKVISELSLMGISAVQLMPSIESVCKKALNDLIGLQPVGRVKRD
jgi:hypothetical protein